MSPEDRRKHAEAFIDFCRVYYSRKTLRNRFRRCEEALEEADPDDDFPVLCSSTNYDCECCPYNMYEDDIEKMELKCHYTHKSVAELLDDVRLIRSLL